MLVLGETFITVSTRQSTLAGSGFLNVNSTLPLIKPERYGYHTTEAQALQTVDVQGSSSIQNVLSGKNN